MSGGKTAADLAREVVDGWLAECEVRQITGGARLERRIAAALDAERAAATAREGAARAEERAACAAIARESYAAAERSRADLIAVEVMDDRQRRAGIAAIEERSLTALQILDDIEARATATAADEGESDG